MLFSYSFYGSIWFVEQFYSAIVFLERPRDGHKTNANSCTHKHTYTHTPQHWWKSWGEKRPKQTKMQICLYTLAKRNISRNLFIIFHANFIRNYTQYKAKALVSAVKFVFTTGTFMEISR